MFKDYKSTYVCFSVQSQFRSFNLHVHMDTDKIGGDVNNIFISSKKTKKVTKLLLGTLFTHPFL